MYLQYESPPVLSCRSPSRAGAIRRRVLRQPKDALTPAAFSVEAAEQWALHRAAGLDADPFRLLALWSVSFLVQADPSERKTRYTKLIARPSRTWSWVRSHGRPTNGSCSTTRCAASTWREQRSSPTKPPGFCRAGTRSLGRVITAASSSWEPPQASSMRCSDAGWTSAPPICRRTSLARRLAKWKSLTEGLTRPD